MTSLGSKSEEPVAMGRGTTTPEWSDEELIDYCSTHCKTERALFHRDHILWIWRLAGEPQSTNVHNLPEWVGAHEDAMMPLVVAARERLKGKMQTNTLEKAREWNAKHEAQRALSVLVVEACPIGLYTHRHGGEYVVFTHTIHEATLQPFVHYFALDHGTRWSHSIADFTKVVEGKPRFWRVRDATPAELRIARTES